MYKYKKQKITIMKQKLFLLLCSALLYIPADAQNGWLPPVTFPNNTAMCDDAS